MNCVYMYRVKIDSGFAPCVDEEFLSLACCKGGSIRKEKTIKTGLRYWIGEKRDADWTKDNVYVVGIYKDKFLYMAKVTKVLKMEDYYNGLSEGRLDDIYDRNLKRSKKLRKQKVHTDEEQQKRDRAGTYVLYSDDFIYLGKDAPYSPLLAEKSAKRQETKKYYGEEADRIIKECNKYRDNQYHAQNEPIERSCNQR